MKDFPLPTFEIHTKYLYILRKNYLAIKRLFILIERGQWKYNFWIVTIVDVRTKAQRNKFSTKRIFPLRLVTKSK